MRTLIHSLTVVLGRHHDGRPGGGWRPEGHQECGRAWGTPKDTGEVQLCSHSVSRIFLALIELSCDRDQINFIIRILLHFKNSPALAPAQPDNIIGSGNSQSM